MINGFSGYINLQKIFLNAEDSQSESLDKLFKSRKKAAVSINSNDSSRIKDALPKYAD